jgi:hypothetical protein
MLVEPTLARERNQVDIVSVDREAQGERSALHEEGPLTLVLAEPHPPASGSTLGPRLVETPAASR